MGIRCLPPITGRLSWRRRHAILAVCALAGCLLVLSPAAAFATAGPERAPLNPAFVQYQKALRSGDLLLSTAAGGHLLGLPPDPVLTPSAPGEPGPGDPVGLPAAFDLRTSNWVTSVKDQGAFGTCWTFATFGSTESWLLRNAAYLYDFSEDNVALTSGFDYDPYNGGGTHTMSTAYLARRGPVLESDDPYGDGVTPAGLQARVRLRDMDIICNDTASTKSQDADIAAVKSWLYDTGAVYTTMLWSSANYQSATAAYYGGTSLYTPPNSGHAVTIVGWDDTYAASNFASAPPGDGAWLVKNSWGTSWGEAGYFHLSYYDYWAERLAVGFVAGGVGDYTTTYQYDPLGRVNTYGYSSGPTPTVAWAANDFTAASSDPITMAGFYTPVAGTAYEIYTASTHSGTRTLRASGTATMAGYHTVPLGTSLSVSPGESFSVILKLTSPGYNWPQAMEFVLAGYSSAATSQAGQSFMSPDGTTWTDVGDPGNATPRNACIKAFARPSASDSTPPTTSVSGVPGGWSRTPVTATFNADDGAGWGVLFTQARVDSGAYSQCSSVQVTGEGTHTLYYCSSDKAGNMEGNKSATVKIDGTAPSASARISAPGSPSASGWYDCSPVTLNVTGADVAGGSGLAELQYRVQGAASWTTYGGPVTVSPGTTAFDYRAVDVAGNASLPGTISASVDTSAPWTTAFAAAGRTRRAVALKYQVNDASPGCGSATAVIKIYKKAKLTRTLKPVICGTNVKMTYRWRCSLAAGRYIIRVFATDAAGNPQSRVGSARLTVR
jgi:C1A family cysteine protease